MSSVRRFSSGGETIEVWSALDALVLKATSIVVAAHCLPELSMRCYHIEGRGGAKAAVRFVDPYRADNTFIFRTDVKGYYARIDHETSDESKDESIRLCPRTTRAFPSRVGYCSCRRRLRVRSPATRRASFGSMAS